MELLIKYGRNLETTKWFVNFSFENIDILLPSDIILESRYNTSVESSVRWNNKAVPVVNIDMLIKQQICVNVPEKVTSTLIVNSAHIYAVQTGVSPQLVKIHLSEFKLMPEIVHLYSLSRGIFAFRFFENKIQYAVDLNVFLEKSGVYV